MTRKQIEKAFGEEFADYAFRLQRIVKIEGEDQIQYAGAWKPDKNDYKLGRHEVEIDGITCEAKPGFHKTIAGITSAERVTIPLRIFFESRKLSAYIERNMGNDKLRMKFRSIEEEDIQDTIPGTGTRKGKNGTLNFDAAAPQVQ